MTEFVVYDVFTDEPFGGNPLAVIPDARGLAEADLQRIAREFNFSETAFVFPPAADGTDARIRIFTPMQEIPFAGHPTIGTAFALFDLGLVGREMVLGLPIGPIPVTMDNGEARFVTSTPLQTWPDIPTDVVAGAAGLGPSDIVVDTHAPLIASVGIPFGIAELCDAETLARAAAETGGFRAFEGHWPAETHFSLLLYVRREDIIQARMFAPLDGIPEDPATGSAAAALAALLGTLSGQSATFQVTQGVEMGRPSQITAEVTMERGALLSVAISGRAVRTMTGQLTL